MRILNYHHRHTLTNSQWPRQTYKQLACTVVLPRRRYQSTEGLSIRTGPSHPPLLKDTISQHFSRVVAAHGDRVAVIARSPASSAIPRPAAETLLTYHELDILSNRLADSLASLGVYKGVPVAVSLGNGAEYAALTYALFKLGAVLVPLNPSFNATQVESALRHLGVEVLVMGAVTDTAYHPGRGRSNEEILRKVVGDVGKGTQILESKSVPSLKRVVVVDNTGSHPSVKFDLEGCRDFTPYRSLLQGSDHPPKLALPLHPDDVINIQFTSGTTSAPKAAMLSHANILNNGALIAHRMGLDPTDRIVVPPPLYHCFGCVLGYMASATTGSAILFPSPAFDPVATLKMCVDHDATGLYGVSTMLVAVLEVLENNTETSTVPHSPRSLRKGIAAGSSIPESLMRKIYQRLGLEDLVICYGMTETSPVNCMSRPSDPFTKRCSTVGTPMPHTSVKIVSPTDRSRILPLGQRGELAAAGYLLMKGYHSNPAKTAEVMVADPTADGGKVWMYSGDEAEMDADGFVTITGRIKDLIIRGGENIHPLEVENCLFQLSGVKEASVVGVPDERLGEAVAAFIIPRQGWGTSDSDEPGKATLKDHGAQGDDTGGGIHINAGTISRGHVRQWVRTNLSSHLVPKYVFWVDEYPKTASGKIQKFKLVDTAKELLGMAK